MWRNKVKSGSSFFHLLSKFDSFIIFDTETMGLKEHDEILQFSGKLYTIQKENYSFTTKETIDLYIKPKKTIPKKIISLTGITNEFIADYPQEEDVVKEIFSFLNKADFSIAYNANFDRKKLEGMASRCGYFVQQMPKMLDLLPMVRDCFINEPVDNFKLETIVEYCRPDNDLTFHSSIEDVQASQYILEECIKIYKEAILYSYDEEKKQIAHLNWASPFINPKMPSMQRIRLNINDDRFGNIYWDIRKKGWDCKRDSFSRKLFKQVDLANLE